MTLLDLDNVLVNYNFQSMFDFAMNGDILDIENMTGSVADIKGVNVIEFTIVKLEDFDDYMHSIITLDDYPNLGYLENDLASQNRYIS